MGLASATPCGGPRRRIGLPDEDTIYRVVRRIRARPDTHWLVVREYDYIAQPKDTGYRGIHLVVKRDGRLIEIQLRTPSQHRWALNVEGIDLARRFGVKDGRGPEGLQRLLERSAYALEALSKGETMSAEFDAEFERLRRIANDELSTREE